MTYYPNPESHLTKKELLQRLEEAEETLRAIRSGEVDALVVSGRQGDQIFTLKDATLPYQILIEEMTEGALTLTFDGIILYCNSRFAEILDLPMQNILGESFLRFVVPDDQVNATKLLKQRSDGKSRGELTLLGGRAEIPAGISLKEILLDGELRLGAVISDRTEIKRINEELRRYQHQLEDLVEERTRELKAANESLQLEIAERKLAEEDLVRSNQKLDEILASIQDDFYVLDRDWNFAFANRLFTLKVGKEPQEFVGRNIWEMFPKHAGTILEENLRAAMEKREIQRFELGGKYTAAWYRMTAFPSADGITVLGTDITERKRAELALLESENRFRTIFQSVPGIAVQGYALDGTTQYWNSASERLYGYSAQEAIGQNLLDLIIPLEIRNDVGQAIQQMAKTGEPIPAAELSLMRKDGSRVPVYSSHAIVSIPGRPPELFCLDVDLTDRKRMEEALQESEEKWRSLFNLLPVGVSIVDSKNRVLDVNPALSQILDISQEALLKGEYQKRKYFRSDATPMPAEEFPSTRAAKEQIIVRDVEIGVEKEDGAVFWTSVSAAPFASGASTATVTIDITERKRVEEILARQAEDLRRSNTELEQFAYVASHDLQEPLRIMSSYSQLLEKRYKDRLDQDADEFIDFIVDAAARMQKLITDLLAYSRAGHEKTDLTEMDCDRVLRKLLANMSATIDAADGSVTFDPLPVIPIYETSLVQLFQNLIVNALKFRSEEPPKIHVSARRAENEWIFSVRDNGIGIEPQYNQRIFMIFQRLHSREKYPGTGIGLSICKKIVENLGGRIWLESELGQGSIFYFTVPVAKKGSAAS